MHDFVLSGIITCHYCGALLQGATAKCGKFLYYRHNAASGCDRAAWPALVVEEAILARLDRYVSQPSVFDRLVDEANAATIAEVAKATTELEEAKRRVVRIEAEMSGLERRLCELPPGVSPDWIFGIARSW